MRSGLTGLVSLGFNVLKWFIILIQSGRYSIFISFNKNIRRKVQGHFYKHL